MLLNLCVYSVSFSWKFACSAPLKYYAKELSLFLLLRLKHI